MPTNEMSRCGCGVRAHLVRNPPFRFSFTPINVDLTQHFTVICLRLIQMPILFISINISQAKAEKSASNLRVFNLYLDVNQNVKLVQRLNLIGGERERGGMEEGER